MTLPLVTRMGQNTRSCASWCTVIMTLIVALPGCVSPIAINRAIVAYDQSVIQAENELLLINLLRMRDEELPHFTITASIIHRVAPVHRRCAIEATTLTSSPENKAFA